MDEYHWRSVSSSGYDSAVRDVTLMTPYQHYIRVLGTHLVAKAHTFSSDFHPKGLQGCLDRRALSPLTSGSTKQSTMSAHLRVIHMCPIGHWIIYFGKTT